MPFLACFYYSHVILGGNCSCGLTNFLSWKLWLMLMCTHLLVHPHLLCRWGLCYRAIISCYPHMSCNIKGGVKYCIFKMHLIIQAMRWEDSIKGSNCCFHLWVVLSSICYYICFSCLSPVSVKKSYNINWLGFQIRNNIFEKKLEGNPFLLNLRTNKSICNRKIKFLMICYILLFSLLP